VKTHITLNVWYFVNLDKWCICFVFMLFWIEDVAILFFGNSINKKSPFNKELFSLLKISNIRYFKIILFNGSERQVVLLEWRLINTVFTLSETYCCFIVQIIIFIRHLKKFHLLWIFFKIPSRIFSKNNSAQWNCIIWKHIF